MILGLYNDDKIIQEETSISELDTEQTPTETPEDTESVDVESTENEAPVDTGDEPSNDDIESIEIVDDDEMEESPEDNSGDEFSSDSDTETPIEGAPEETENIDSESKEIDNFADDMEKPAEPVPNNDVYFNGENPYQTQTTPVDTPTSSDTTSTPIASAIATATPTESTPTTVGIDVTMTNFGTDNSQCQNQYDPKEIERLNDLIASENSAIGEYFQGSKETNVDVLRRLYSDIGEEERFHVEQLLFAKSQITGERYVPRDPDIKKEYEELLSMGMDEESAMATAADKVGLMSKSFTTSPDEAIHEMDQIIDQVNLVQEHLFYNHLISSIIEQPLSTSTSDRDNAMSVFIESYIDNTYDIPVSVILEEGELQFNNNGSALKSAGGIISTIGRMLRNLLGLIVSFVKKSGKFVAAKARWLKNHKLSDVFKEGFNLYFYNIEKGGKAGFAFDEAAKYLVRLQYCCVMIAQQAGIQFQKPSYKYQALVQDNWHPSDIRAAMNDIRHVSLMKTKVTIDESNSEMFKETVFGVSGNMDNPSSDGVFAKLTLLLSDFTHLMDSISKLINDFKGLQNQTNQANLYHSKPAIYRELEGYLLIISKKSQAFANYISHDIGVLQNMNNTLNKVAEQDVQSGDEMNSAVVASEENFNNIRKQISNADAVAESATSEEKIEEQLNILYELRDQIENQLNGSNGGNS